MISSKNYIKKYNIRNLKNPSLIKNIIQILFTTCLIYILYFNTHLIKNLSLNTNIIILIKSLTILSIADLIKDFFSFFLNKRILRNIYIKRIMNFDFNTTHLKLLRVIINYTIYLIAVIYILMLWNINIVPLLASMGIAGLILGLAIKEPIEQVLNGMALVIEGTIKIGKQIKVDKYEGEIIDINLRTIKLLTNEGVVVIPNKILSNKPITEIKINKILHKNK